VVHYDWPALKAALVKISHEIPMGYHGKSWDAMVIALFTKGNQKIPWGIPWKTMVRFSKPWDTHNMPWELWDAMGITLVAMGNPINPWGIPWKTIHGVLQQAMGYPQYAMGIIWDAMGLHLSPGEIR
jgi:hypothetical protein